MKFKYYFYIFNLLLFFTIKAYAEVLNPFSRIIYFNEPLRLYSPQELIMVGTISQETGILGIVKAPDNKVYTVKPGSQLANHAYVVDVTPRKITVQQDSHITELNLRQLKDN